MAAVPESNRSNMRKGVKASSGNPKSKAVPGTIPGRGTGTRLTKSEPKIPKRLYLS